MSDEGVGIHAIEYLFKLTWPDDIELIDGGTGGISILHIIEDRKLAVIIDCADFGGFPGEIRILNPSDLTRDENSQISLHATDLLTVLEMGKRTGNRAQSTIILGIQPKKIEMGMVLSPEVLATLKQIPEMLKRVFWHCS